jgi:hypothetical protein
MAQATHLERTTAADRAMVQATGTQRALSHAAGTNYTLTQSAQTYVNDVAAMLAEAVWYIDAAADGYSGGQTVPNLGTGLTALDATLGSTGGSDTNDPAWLDHTGTNYVWLPGTSGSFLSTPDAAALDVTDLDIRFRVSMEDWTPASAQGLVTKYETAGQRSFFVWISSSGNVVVYWTPDGSTTNAKQSTVATGFTDGTTHWLRVVLDVSNGGNHDVLFYTAADAAAEPSSWTQLGTTVTTAGTTTLFAGTSELRVGAASGTFLAGSTYRTILKDGIAGTTVLDVDTSVITDGSATTFTEQSSNAATVTINRSTSGRKAVCVTQPVWALGSDDYMEVADNALLDMGASDSFTVLAVVRQWGTPASFGRFMGKYASSVGWLLLNNSTTNAQYFLINDGAGQVVGGTPTALTAGTLGVIGGVRNVTTDRVQTIQNGTIHTGSVDTSTGTLANASVLDVGRNPGGGDHVDAEVVAAAIWRRALTTAELTAITTYFTTRG